MLDLSLSEGCNQHQDTDRRDDQYQRDQMATLKLTGFEGALSTLASLPLEMRGPVIKSALRKAGKIVVVRAKKLAPPKGYPGDKPEFKALSEAIAVEIKDYDNAVVAIVGPKLPTRHGHLVEGVDSKGENVDVRHHSRGKPTGVTLKKHPFMGPASRDTKEQQRAAITEGIRKASAKAKR